MDIIHPGQQNKQLMCSSMDELTPKVRKPYTITKQRERWTEDEHHKFLEALKLHGRAWRRIEEHIGTKTAVQIRSHAQKFFSKVARDSAMGGAAPLEPIEIPPPRPKKKPVHPYPRKLGNSSPKSQASPVAEERSPSPVSSLSEHENLSPTSVLSAVGSPDHSGVEENASQKTDLSDEATAAAPTSLKLFGRTVQVAAASPQKPSSPVQEPESQRVPSSCEWSAWPWGMMPQIIYCPSLVPDLASATEAAAVASSPPWWASLQFMPLTSYQGNPPPEQKESSDVTAGEETGSSSENEGRGFVPYRRCLAERKAGQLEPPAEGIRLCL